MANLMITFNDTEGLPRAWGMGPEAKAAQVYGCAYANLLAYVAGKPASCQPRMGDFHPRVEILK